MKNKLILLALLLVIFKTDAQTSVLAIAEDYLEKGDYQSALQKLKAEESPLVEVLIKIADIYQKTGNYANAINYYNKVYELKPSDKVKEQLGKCYQYAGNSEKAMDLQSQVLKDNPDNLLLQYNLAKLYTASRKTNKAIDLFNGLVEKDTKNPNYYYELGKAFEIIKKDPSKNYLKAFELDSLHIKSIYQLATFFDKIKVRDSSGIFINKGLAISPNNLNFLQLKAQHVFLEKEYDTTIVYLKKLESQNFKTPFVNKLFGLSYFKLGDYENAMLYFEKAKKADRRDANVYYNIGLIHNAKKEFRKAERSFTMSIFFHKPDVDKIYLELGKVQLERKDVKKALESFEQGLKNNPRNRQLAMQIAMTSDGYYKDKSIALKHYEYYVRRFFSYDKESTLYAESRIKEIKKELFMKGVTEE